MSRFGARGGTGSIPSASCLQHSPRCCTRDVSHVWCCVCTCSCTHRGAAICSSVPAQAQPCFIKRADREKSARRAFSSNVLAAALDAVRPETPRSSSSPASLLKLSCQSAFPPRVSRGRAASFSQVNRKKLSIFQLFQNFDRDRSGDLCGNPSPSPTQSCVISLASPRPERRRAGGLDRVASSL